MGRFKSSIKLDTKILKKLKREFRKLNKTDVEFGWINGKKYPSNDPSVSRRGVYIASIAYMNEKGHYTLNNDGGVIYVPARPYFQQSLHNIGFLGDSLEKVVLNILNGKPFRPVLSFIGQDMVDNVKKSVAKQNFKALHPKTISIKDKSTQWVDTGRMLENITYKVTYRRGASGTTYDAF